MGIPRALLLSRLSWPVSPSPWHRSLLRHGRAAPKARDPAIHAFLRGQDVDARHKAGHDDEENGDTLFSFPDRDFFRPGPLLPSIFPSGHKREQERRRTHGKEKCARRRALLRDFRWDRPKPPSPAIAGHSGPHPDRA